MARKSPVPKERSPAKDLLLEVHDNYKKCVDFERDNRENYREDMKFVHVAGEQWDETTKRKRGKHRPMYEFNHTRVTVKNVINTMRSARPSAKIRGAEEGDKATAEAFEGLAKNIWNSSDGDSVTDYAAEHQCGGGFGVWRIDTKYATEESFDQDIMLSAGHNPLCFYADYACQDPLKRDARFWFVHSRISKEDYARRWPNKAVIQFEPDEQLELDELDDEDRVWICEYWKKEPVTRNICLLSDGSVIDKEAEAKDGSNALPEGVTVVKERRVSGHKIVQYLCSGDAILEGPNDWAGREFPFVIVYGDYAVVDGKPIWCGVARYMKDAQRAHNWAMTSVFETIATAPKDKTWATAKQADGLASQWADSDEKNLPFNLYNPDPAAPGPPARIGGPQVPAALIQAAQMSTDEMKASSGIYDASLGARSNEQSGRAINARAAQGQIATFNFQDNMLKAVQRTYEILIDLIPKVYDTQRTFRILGADGSESYVAVNKFDPLTGEKINDLSKGKYDIVITSGPSFATQRMEAAETYMGMMQSNPVLAQIAGDLIIKSTDLPLSDQIAERIRATLPPPIQALLNKDKAVSPESQAMMMQAEQAMQMVQEQGQLVEQAAQEAQQEKAGADKAKADVQVASANLKVQEAQLNQSVAEFKALVAETQAKMAQQASVSVTQKGDEGMAQMGQALEAALGQIQEQAGQILQVYAQQLAEFQAQTVQAVQQQVAVGQNRPRVARTKRVNGEFITTVSDAETGEVLQEIPTQRVNGELVTTVQ